MKFRSKIVDIEAYQVKTENFNTLTGDPTPKWISANLRDKKIDFSTLFTEGTFQVLSREGWVKGEVGCWIIKGLEDEIYICKDSVFKAKYEPI